MVDDQRQQENIAPGSKANICKRQWHIKVALQTFHGSFEANQDVLLKVVSTSFSSTSIKGANLCYVNLSLDQIAQFITYVPKYQYCVGSRTVAKDRMKASLSVFSFTMLPRILDVVTIAIIVIIA